ncbi:MAG: LysR substrate-binding domain-containing protein [Microthrixaceae bacterium]|nr:LysR family transcriptional regulator [Microthrixaceae bacterium]MCO5314373.1 LysR substrate-binding domain-containing protein [Microthrixaceae bacterium]
MNLRDLRYLVAVADHHHFGRAAEACFVSQPTLSTQIKKLEAELGVELIERTPRQALLTAPGERVVERARIVLAEADSIRRIAQQANDPESGTVRMGLFPTIAPYVLPHVVGNLRTKFPKLELLLVEEKTEVIVERLREGNLDIGVLALPIADFGFLSAPLFREDFVLAVPKGHHLASAPQPLKLEAIAKENVLLLEEGHCLRQQALSVCQLAGAGERSEFRATSLETLRQMVAAGVGVTLLPELAVQPPVPMSPDIEILRFADPAPSRELAMFWRDTSIYASLYPRLAEVMRDLPEGLVEPIT